eukprot:599516-Alexandrium_andersonii.AAC.1
MPLAHPRLVSLHPARIGKGSAAGSSCVAPCICWREGVCSTRWWQFALCVIHTAVNRIALAEQR